MAVRQSRNEFGAQPAVFLAKRGAVFARFRTALTTHNLLLYASSFAFYAFLMLLPALAAALSLYGLVGPPEIGRAVESVRGLAPGNALGFIRQQIDIIASDSASSLGATLFLGIALTLWSGTQGMKMLMAGLNAVYNARETRRASQVYATALWLSLGALLFTFVALGLIADLPAAFEDLGLPGATIASVLRWPLLAVTTALTLAVLYRFGPCRRPLWRFVSPGAGLATAIWLVGSVFFSLYISSVNNFNGIYGSIGAIVVLLLWFYLSALVILLGAAFNAAVERPGQ
jgi:membrane protein